MTTERQAHGAGPREPAAADPFATRAPTTPPATPAAPASAGDPLALSPGDRIDDFEIVSPLGRGSFGAVYRARQVSLDRQVALKVSACRGREGRTLARLDHPNIVSVYSQQSNDGILLLCMQYVPSSALDDLLRLLSPLASSWNGADLLAALDRAATAAAEFDPTQLADRSLLSGLDHVGAACFLGSAVSIPYNLLRVVPAEHEAFFLKTVNEYNLVVYTLCVAVLWAVIHPVFLAWRGRSGETPESLRGRVLFLPRWAARLAVLGWLPAALYFPWALRACELPWDRVAHFHVSITIAGLIALTYSALAVLCVVTWIFYPALWVDPTDFRSRAAREITPALAALRSLPFLAGAIPLVGAILLVTASPQTFSDGEYEAFRLLTVVLIALGMAGFQGARWAMARARRALEPILSTPA